MVAASRKYTSCFCCLLPGTANDTSVVSHKQEKLLPIAAGIRTINKIVFFTSFGYGLR